MTLLTRRYNFVLSLFEQSKAYAPEKRLEYKEPANA